MDMTTFRIFLTGLLSGDIKQGRCEGSFREEPFLISEEMLSSEINSEINNEYDISEDTLINIVWNSIFYTGMIKSGKCGNINDAKELLDTNVSFITPSALEPDTFFKNKIYYYLKKAKEVAILKEGTVIRTFKESTISGTIISKATNVLSFTLGFEDTCSVDMDKIISVYLKKFSNGSTLCISTKGDSYEERPF